MRTTQKAAVGVFMCLSLIMVVIAICQVTNMGGHVEINFPNEIFWQFLEAEVAVLMTSLTAYRTFFVLCRNRQRYQERMRRPSHSFPRFKPKKQNSDFTTNDVESRLPRIPPPTMTSLKTFIGGHNRMDVQNIVVFAVTIPAISYEKNEASFITKPDGIFEPTSRHSFE